MKPVLGLKPRAAMARCVRRRLSMSSAILALGTALVLATGAAAEPSVTLRMKGGGPFEVSGSLKSYDLQHFVIVAPGIGTLSLDATRYECVGAECPTAAVGPPRGLQLSGTTRAVWSGDGALGNEFMPRLVRAFAASIGASVETHLAADGQDVTLRLVGADERPLGEIVLMRRGEASAIAALAKGEADVAWSSRSLAAQEEEALTAAGLGNLRSEPGQLVLGSSAVAVVTARDNPLLAPSLDDIAKIFAGQISNWSQLDLPAGPVNLHLPAADSQARRDFEALVLRPRGLSWGSNILDEGGQDLGAWADAIGEDRNAIGIIGLSGGTLPRSVRLLNVAQACGIISEPTVFAAKTGEYPLSRHLYLYVDTRRSNPLSKALLDFTQSSAMRPVLQESQLIDREIEVAAFREHTARIAAALNARTEDFDSDLMRNLLEELRESRRLSISLQFNADGRGLTPRSTAELTRVRNQLVGGSIPGRRVLLAGFSEPGGAFATSLAKSKRRAKIARVALAQGGPNVGTMAIVEKGFSALAPVACSDTDKGRLLNQRVEVWVR